MAWPSLCSAMMSKRRRLWSPVRRGLVEMLFACLLFSLMNASVYAIQLFEAGVSATVISFVRVSSNLLILLTVAVFNGRVLALFGDGRPSLWLRGLFGALALMLSFAAITRIGPGESAFLTASSGVFVALLSPFVLGQKSSWLMWLAILGSFTGVILLFRPDEPGVDFLGKGMALLSGFLSALAYLMVARAGRSNRPQSVIFYFCLVAMLIHLAFFAYSGCEWPKMVATWGLLLATGVLGSGAQYFMTRAYQLSPAALVSAVGYLVPVLSLAWGVCFFGQIPGHTALAGTALIMLFGVLLPFLK